MDTDSLPSAPIFLVSLLLFGYLSLLHHWGAEVSRTEVFRTSERDQKLRSILAPLLRWLQAAVIFAVVLSGLALAHSVATTQWWPISLMAVGLLAGLFLLDRLGRELALRIPALARPWIKSNGSISSNGQRSETGAEGDGPSVGVDGYSSTEPDGLVITEEEQTGLDTRDREMLRSILRMDVTTVREVMVPRLDMDAVDADASLEMVAETMIEHGRSRLPVYEESIDRILGIVHSRDIMAALAWPKSENTLRNLVRPAFIIPETKRVDDLLEELQERRTQMAIVVDEYGGTEGLVTMEDLLEEIVGEIEDEFSRTREAQVMRQPDGAVLVDAGVTTEDVEEIFGTRIDSTVVDTVGGYVYHSLGRIPQAGDVVETEDLTIEVISILGRRLRRLRIRRLDRDSAGSAV